MDSEAGLRVFVTYIVDCQKKVNVLAVLLPHSIVRVLNIFSLPWMLAL